MTDRYSGNDNYGKPKSDYIQRLEGLDDKALVDECDSLIWLSAYANNNPRSDYHWQCDACCGETRRRKKPEIYDNAHKLLVAQYS